MVVAASDRLEATRQDAELLSAADSLIRSEEAGERIADADSREIVRGRHDRVAFVVEPGACGRGKPQVPAAEQTSENPQAAVPLLRRGDVWSVAVRAVTQLVPAGGEGGGEQAPVAQ